MRTPEPPAAPAGAAPLPGLSRRRRLRAGRAPAAADRPPRGRSGTPPADARRRRAFRDGTRRGPAGCRWRPRGSLRSRGRERLSGWARRDRPALAPGQWGSGHLEEARLSPGTRPSVLLVLVDTLRDDHLTPALMPQTPRRRGARRFLDTRPTPRTSFARQPDGSPPPLALTAPDGTSSAWLPTYRRWPRYCEAVATAAFSANGTLRRRTASVAASLLAGTGAAEALPTDAAGSLPLPRWPPPATRTVRLIHHGAARALRDHEGRGRPRSRRGSSPPGPAPTPRRPRRSAPYAGEVRLPRPPPGPFAALEPGATVRSPPTTARCSARRPPGATERRSRSGDPGAAPARRPGIPAGDDPAPRRCSTSRRRPRPGGPQPAWRRRVRLLTAPPPPTRVRLADLHVGRCAGSGSGGR